MDVSAIHRRKFGPDAEFRQEMYRVLCEEFFQDYISDEWVVLDIGAGYCGFSNNIRAKRRIALDIDPDIDLHAKRGVDVLRGKSTKIDLADGSVDVVFMSNFLEHLTREDILLTMKEVNRVLRPRGRLLILSPNYRYCYKDYFMFFDHITPLDDRSLCEVLELNRFDVRECLPQFLPYTTKGSLPKSTFLLKIYLWLPILHLIFGKQAFIYARKGDV